MINHKLFLIDLLSLNGINCRNLDFFKKKNFVKLNLLLF